MLDALNEQFALEDRIVFREGPGGLPVAAIAHPSGTATVALHGGHVLAYQPAGAAPVLWVSRASRYAPGVPIRGGIPVCWPWFGPDPTERGRPSHGFARTLDWRVVNTRYLGDEAVQVRLELIAGERTRALWPHDFELEIAVTVGGVLNVALEVRNPGASSFTYTGALHSYFSVSDIDAVSIHGFEGTSYIDQLDVGASGVQRGPIRFEAETDRIYFDTVAACVLDDPGLGRRIEVARSGSLSAVVWNPWIAKAARMSDFGDDEYREMLCIEAANAGPDQVNVAPGDCHRLTTTLTVKGRS